MSDLRKQVGDCAVALQDAWIGLQKASEPALPRKCYEHWQKRAMYHQALSGTIAIFRAREVAWEIVQSLTGIGDVRGKPGIVLYCGAEMEFAVARHLALASFVSVTWSIYDRIANVCGRLAGIADLADNPKQNPKTCEDFLGKKDVLGFTSHLHIREAYSWPLKVSYKIRNWLVHEGYEDGGTPLFRGDRTSDGILLHNDAIQQLQNTCGYSDVEGKIALSCISMEKECWGRGNLLEILESYHSEVDTMFTALLRWSVESFVGQIRSFAARDQV